MPALKLLGSGEKTPLTIFILKRCRLGASKGGFKAQSSYNTTPNDQTSVLRV
jgi:hypothetical protein